MIVSDNTKCRASFLLNDPNKNISYKERWSEFDSKILIKRAKAIYHDYLCQSSYSKNPSGVIVNKQSGKGRVVFSQPILLPDEYYLRIKYIISKQQRRNK